MPGVKRSRKKAVDNEEKENSNTVVDDGEDDAAMRKKAATMVSSVLISSIDNKEEIERLESDELIQQYSESKESDEYGNDLMDMVHNIDGNNEPQGEYKSRTPIEDEVNTLSCRGKKRPFDHIENLIGNENISSDENDTQGNDGRTLRKRCKTPMKELQGYGSDYISLSEHPSVTEYNVGVADVARNTKENLDEKSNLFISQLIKSFNLEKNDLSKLKKRTATATARAIIRHQFPNPTEGFRFANVDLSTIEKIIQLSKYLNPTDASSKEKLRKAMGNYFASVKFARKIKSMIVANEES